MVTLHHTKLRLKYGGSVGEIASELQEEMNILKVIIIETKEASDRLFVMSALTHYAGIATFLEDYDKGLIQL